VGDNAAAINGGSGRDVVKNQYRTFTIDRGAGYDRVEAKDATDGRRCEDTYP
jgi:hypothetical protein